ncbi:transcription factor bHLH113-like isoform X1 [Glycine soja]|uniref:Transcription factor bHLH113 isoform A n=1 Tax=Glycine soja TaxID=3848 RepID=A0A445ITB4_GLYSO|nr:transcription factor bHLH113-like isoform X1 [Glycine soja]XP_028185174.1 transcription factor bHLH113-like isoform X1 [Glycine soja]KHN06774.1 Transcription factor bHLH113 [Glycine soja]RZB89194.1 Transcription factor bHLH113 isoform A [Glycine soja]
MEAKKEYEVDHLSTPTGTSFSQLLFGDDDDDVDESALGLAVDQSYSYNYNNLTRSPLFSIHKAPQMLCFGNHQNEEGDVLLPETNLTPQKSVITSSDSSSASASSCNHTNTAFNSLPKSNNSLQKKRQEGVAKVGVGSQRQTKKNKAENPTSTGHAKRKEKLGERIATLQQLVSPFGKTDTASVLHEAMGYIRFLHDQVQVLCSPYLQSLPSSYHQNQHGGGGNNEEEVNKDLRSKGLCLIPVGCTVHVAGSNGADFWSSAAIGNNVSFTISQAVKRNQDQ